MITNIQAVYEGGVLRPTEPLALLEGETVNVAITPIKSPEFRLREPSDAEKDYARRIRSAKSVQEMFAVMASAPSSPEDDFDIVKEMNASRRLTGFRMPDPESTEETPR